MGAETRSRDEQSEKRDEEAREPHTSTTVDITSVAKTSNIKYYLDEESEPKGGQHYKESANEGSVTF
jgi:hypothetical protein